jgi:hypothetical protein
MKLIEITKLPNGGHRNIYSDSLKLAKGWAVIPDDMETPNYPFGEIEVEEIDGVMTVTKWIPGTIPEVEETEAEPTIDEVVDRLLGVTN